MSYLPRVIERIQAGDAIRFRRDYYGSNYVSIKGRWQALLPWWPRSWMKLNSLEIQQVKEALHRRRRDRRQQAA